MSEKKKSIVSTLCKVAAAALFVPNELSVCEGGKRVTVKSIAASVDYTAAKCGKPANLTVTVPGGIGKYVLKFGGKSYVFGAKDDDEKAEDFAADAGSSAEEAEGYTAEAGDFESEIEAFAANERAAEDTNGTGKGNSYDGNDLFQE